MGLRCANGNGTVELTSQKKEEPDEDYHREDANDPTAT